MTPTRALIWAAVSTKAQASEDKDSIPRQIEDARALCALNGWQIVDTLVVDGHSRYYTDFHEAAADMRAAGIDALDKLKLYCQLRAFDIFVVRDGSRFARRQSIHAYIVEMIIDAGAKIYAAMYGGYIDAKNYAMFVAMDGYRVAGESSVRRDLSAMGKQRQVKNAIPITKSPYGFRKVRDMETGKITRLEPEPTAALVLRLAGEMLLQGLAYNKICDRLAAIGYGRDNGKPFLSRQLWRYLVDPWIWGHTVYGVARAYAAPQHRQTKIIGAWCLDPAYAIPAPLQGEIEIHYHVHAPLFSDSTGNLSVFGHAVRAEIIRRMSMPSSANKANKRGKFTGLLVCAHCGHTMTLSLGSKTRSSTRQYRGYRCISSWRRKGQTPCQQYLNISERFVEAWMRLFIEKVVIGDDFTLLQPPILADDHLEDVAAQIAEKDRQLATLIMAQAAATSAVLINAYKVQIDAIVAQLETLQKRQIDLRQRAAAAVNASRFHASAHIRDVLDRFWELPAPEINHWLHMLFGTARVVVQRGARGGEIAGVRLRYANEE